MGTSSVVWRPRKYKWTSEIPPSMSTICTPHINSLDERLRYVMVFLQGFFMLSKENHVFLPGDICYVERLTLLIKLVNPCTRKGIAIALQVLFGWVATTAHFNCFLLFLTCLTPPFLNTPRWSLLQPTCPWLSVHQSIVLWKAQPLYHQLLYCLFGANQ